MMRGYILEYSLIISLRVIKISFQPLRHLLTIWFMSKGNVRMASTPPRGSVIFRTLLNKFNMAAAIDGHDHLGLVHF